jgi:peptidoglycan/xylan/chitin deacetylase (PgdA/CDA1 family)
MNKDYIRFPGFKYKALTLSYDDGTRPDKRLISIMKKNGIKGTFNLNSGMLSERYEGVETGRMSVSEMLSAYDPEYTEVAVHGHKHLSLPHYDIALAANDVAKDRSELERIFKRVVKGMAYAFGTYNDEVVSMLRSLGISYARTVNASESFLLPDDWLRLRPTCHHSHKLLMEYARRFVELKFDDSVPFWRRKPQLFYVWGHSYEFEVGNNWNVIEEFCEYIGGKDDIWYATNGEIFDYLTACDRLEFSIDGTYIHNPSAITVYIEYLGKCYTVHGGETVATC